MNIPCTVEWYHSAFLVTFEDGTDILLQSDWEQAAFVVDCGLIVAPDNWDGCPSTLPDWADCDPTEIITVERTTDTGGVVVSLCQPWGKAYKVGDEVQFHRYELEVAPELEEITRFNQVTRTAFDKVIAPYLEKNYPDDLGQWTSAKDETMHNGTSARVDNLKYKGEKIITIITAKNRSFAKVYVQEQIIKKASQQ